MRDPSGKKAMGAFATHDRRGSRMNGTSVRRPGDSGRMSITDVLAIIAGAFGVGMGASPLLQALRAHRRRSSADISLPFLAVLLAGGSAWLAYGIALGNIALIVGNTVGVVSSSAAVAVTIRWRQVDR